MRRENKRERVTDQLRRELNTLKSENKFVLEDLRSTIQEVQRENTQLREEIMALKSQMKLRNQERESKELVCTDKVPINKQTSQRPAIAKTTPIIWKL